MKIQNLYRVPDLLTTFRKLAALEKVHGTSAHVRWADGAVHLFPGGEKIEAFRACFDEAALAEAFQRLGHATVVVHGEAYGGKCQGMRDTYGDLLRFVAFDVRVGETWLDVANAQDVSTKLGLEFVPWEVVDATVEAVDRARDAPSEVARRRGILEPRAREGVVLKPTVELARNDGSRVVAKHKAAAFLETRTPRPTRPEEAVVLAEAQAVALEWATEMRLRHVLDALRASGTAADDLRDTGKVVQAFVADVEAESSGEVVWSPAVRKALGAAAARLYKAHLVASLSTPSQLAARD